MTLLEDLQSLDLSAIVNARGSISASISTPQLQQVLSGGAAQAALGNLGQAIEAVRAAADNPEALFSDLVGAIGQLAGPLANRDLPLSDYLGAVEQGAHILLGVLDGLNGNPANLGAVLGRSLGDTFEATVSAVGQYSFPALDELGSLRSMWETVERGVPHDPAAFAALALDALSPFPRNHLLEIRTSLQAMLDRLAGLTLPAGRTSGLTVALNAVATAASSGDVTRLNVALAELARVRANTITVLRQDTLRLFEQLDRLGLDEALSVIGNAAGTINAGTEGVLEFMDYLRTQVARLRTQVLALETSQVSDYLPVLISFVENAARETIVEPIEEQVRRLEEWVRGLLSHLPLRNLRAELSGFIYSIAQTIQEADIDRYARQVTDLLETLRTTVQSANLGDEVRGALESAQQAIMGALNGIFEALNTIKEAVDAVAGQALAVLQRAVEALSGFRTAIEAITAEIQNLGIEEAAQQAVDSLVRLRETAQELLTAQPLPEPLRPVITQLVDFLNGIDFEQVLEPVRAVAGQLQIPAEVGASIREGLTAVAGALDNLIPQQLIDSIQVEINAALDTIRDFDPARLLDGVTGLVNEAAGFVEGLKPPDSLVATLRQPFETVLNVFDQARPGVLLAPVIEAYDSLLGRLPVPAPGAAVQGITSLIGTAGEAMAGSVGSPMERLVAGASAPSGGGAPGGSGSGTTSSAPPGAVPAASLPPLDNFRPGDIIRVFAFLPQKLREALATLEAGPAGQILAMVDDLSGGLARQLRGLEAALWSIEDNLTAGLENSLAPLAQAQLRAQVAVRANFGAGALDVDLSLEAIAVCGPGEMRQSLREVTGPLYERTRALTVRGGRGSAALDRIASALERSKLASVTGSLEGLLAALDPEPLAAELDALFTAILQKAPGLLNELQAEFRAAIERLQGLVREFNPIAQAQKFLRVLGILREELDLLSPRRLADELDEVHAALRASIAAYDPAILVQSINAVLDEIAAALRGLNPAALLGDLTIFDEVADRLAEVNPVTALQGVGTALEEVGAQLQAINPAELLAAVNTLGPQVVDAFEQAIEDIRHELVTLLESLRFAGASASASVEVEVG